MKPPAGSPLGPSFAGCLIQDPLSALVTAVDDVLAMEAPEGVSVDVEGVGDRPAGTYPEDGVLMTIAREVLTELGQEPKLDVASTDANIPLSMGIPAVCIGITTGANLHREDEYNNVSPISTGFAQMVAVALIAADALA